MWDILSIDGHSGEYSGGEEKSQWKSKGKGGQIEKRAYHFFLLVEKEETVQINWTQRGNSGS